MIKALIFDLDYTLVDASQGIFLCVNYAMKKMNHPEYVYEKVAIIIGIPLLKIFAALTGDDDQEKARTFQNYFIEHAKKVLIDNTRLYDSVIPMLKKAKQQGYKRAIVTSKYRYALDDILDRFKLRDYFDFHIAGNEIENPKPDPSSIIRALAHLKVLPEETVYVGDSDIDAEAAQRAKVNFIAVLTGQTQQEKFFPYPYIAILPNLNRLLDIVSLKNATQNLLIHSKPNEEKKKAQTNHTIKLRSAL